MMVRERSMDVCLLRNKSREDSSIGTLLKINWKEHIVLVKSLFSSSS